MKEILKPGAVLLIICVIAAFALGMVNELTADRIADQRAAKNEVAKQAVLPTAASFTDLDEDALATVVADYAPVTGVYIGVDASGATVGYVFKSTPSGFGGPVEVITGIDMEGNITGLRIGSHSETPGLGAKSVEPAFYEQFAGKSADTYVGVSKTSAEGNDIQAITGATISSSAIVSGVNASIDAYHMLVEGGNGN
jgi:electron transport complex protein RnfG